MSTATVPPHERRALSGATLAGGAEQAVDFVLPLYAGAALRLSPVETGLLVAAVQVAAFALRPLAGAVADRAERAVVAAGGALGLGLACGLFALARGLPLALAAALLTGAAGAFCWVALRALVGERLAADPGVFARLVAAEETGGWVVVVPAVLVLSATGYPVVFAGAAACCLVAAVLLLGARGRPRPATGPTPAGEGDRPLRALRPVLLAVVLTTVAEAALALLLVLHLQRGFGLDVLGVATVFLPGAVALSVLPPHLHRLVLRWGRRRVLELGAVSSALFAAGLALAPDPAVVAALWVLSAASWAAVVPVQQAVVAEVAGPARLGRALGRYEAATLLGAALGSLGAGVLYGAGSWLTACLVCAAVALSGAVVVPAAVGRLGLPDRPREAPAVPAVPAVTAGPLGPVPAAVPQPGRAPREPRKDRRTQLRELAVHTALIGAAVPLGSVLVPGLAVTDLLGVGQGLPDAGGLAVVLRVWVVVWVVDVVWTACAVAATPRGGPGQGGPGRDGPPPTPAGVDGGPSADGVSGRR